MGCGSSMNKGETVGAPQAVAEAEEAALARMREDNAELRRQNANLTSQVQELSQRLNTLTMDVSGLRMEMSAATALASKALQAAQTASERAEAAASTGSARPPTAPGPIPIPAPESQLALRVQLLESQLSVLQDKLDSQKAKEEFAKQLRAAQGDRPPIPPQLQHNNSGGGSSVGGGANATGRPSNGNDYGSTGGSVSSGNGTGGAGAPVIDGNGLLPTNNNFPSRFGGGPAALRPARDRTPVRAGPPGSGGEDWSAHGQASAPAMMQTAGPPGGEFMSTHRYGNVLPSDLKLAEQRKQGPKQFL